MKCRTYDISITTKLKNIRGLRYEILNIINQILSKFKT